MSFEKTHILPDILEDPRAQYATTEKDLYELASAGLKRRSISSLGEWLGLSLGEMADLLSVSERTLRRYDPDKVLESPLSSQLLHIAFLVTRGMEVFGQKERLIGWLQDESLPLGMKRPIELLRNRFGINLVLDEMGRIEHGVFS